MNGSGSDEDDLWSLMPRICQVLQEAESSIDTQQIEAYKQVSSVDQPEKLQHGKFIITGSRRQRVSERRREGTGRRPGNRARKYGERMATISSKRIVAKDADGQDNIAAFYASDEEEQDVIEAASRGSVGTENIPPNLQLDDRVAQGKTRKSWVKKRERRKKGTGREAKRRKFGGDLTGMPDRAIDWDNEELEEEEESPQPHTFDETERREPHPLLAPRMYREQVGERPDEPPHDSAEAPGADNRDEQHGGSAGVSVGEAGFGVAGALHESGSERPRDKSISPQGIAMEQDFLSLVGVSKSGGEEDNAPDVQDLAMEVSGEESSHGVSTRSGSGSGSGRRKGIKQSAETSIEQPTPTERVSDALEVGFPVGDRSYEVPLRDEREEEEADVTEAPAKQVPVERSKADKKRRATNRKSLAAAGMQTSNGVRRSTRTRLRPLEYWRNERMIYGRKHNSLPTFQQLELQSPDPMWPLPSGRKKRFRQPPRTQDLPALPMPPLSPSAVDEGALALAI